MLMKLETTVYLTKNSAGKYEIKDFSLDELVGMLSYGADSFTIRFAFDDEYCEGLEPLVKIRRTCYGTVSVSFTDKGEYGFYETPINERVITYKMGNSEYRETHKDLGSYLQSLMVITDLENIKDLAIHYKIDPQARDIVASIYYGMMGA